MKFYNFNITCGLRSINTCIFKLCCLMMCNHLLAQELILPKNIVEYNINEYKNFKKCEYNSIYFKITDSNESIYFYIDEPLSWYASIFDVKVKSTKLLISFSQKVELPEYVSNIRYKEYFINYSAITNLDEEEKCLLTLKPTKDIKLENKQATGKTKLFPRTRTEKLQIFGFDNSILIPQNDKSWKNNSGILEFDLTNVIKSSKKANQLINLIIKCLTCSEIKSELNEELSSPLNEISLIVDFRFVKNQIDNGVFE